MRGCVRALVVPLLLAAHASPVLGQSWNSAEALALVRRAVDRREAARADSSLASYRLVEDPIRRAKAEERMLPDCPAWIRKRGVGRRVNHAEPR